MDFTINGLLLGLVAIAIGAAFAFWGFRVFLILLPIWGFFAGFLLGLNLWNALFPDPGFLVEVGGWVLGFIVGIVFAVLSYLYYWVAVILLGGVLGYQLTIGLLQWIGFDADGIIAFILGLIVGGVFAVGFFLLQMPAVLVIVATAISGAGAIVGGVVIALGLVPAASLEYGLFGAAEQWDLGWLGIIATIALAFAGAIYQTRAVGDMAAAITADSYMNPGLDNRGGPSGAAPA